MEKNGKKWKKMEKIGKKWKKKDKTAWQPAVANLLCPKA